MSNGTKLAIHFTKEAAREFADAFALLREDQKGHFGTAVFGSSRLKPGTPTYKQVSKIAHQIGLAGSDIIAGGGPGIMEAASEGGNLAKAKGAPIRVKASKIRIPWEPQHGEYDIVVEFDAFEPRVRTMFSMAQAFVVAPGGIGTLKEMMDVIQLLQLGVGFSKDKHDDMDPLIVVYDEWPEAVVPSGGDITPQEAQLMRQHSPWELVKACIGSMAMRGTVSWSDLKLFHVTRDPDEVVRLVTSHMNEYYTRHPRPSHSVTVH